MGLRSAWNRCRNRPVSVQAANPRPDWRGTPIPIEASDPAAIRAREAGYSTDYDPLHHEIIIHGVSWSDLHALGIIIKPTAWYFIDTDRPFAPTSVTFPKSRPTTWESERQWWGPHD